MDIRVDCLVPVAALELDLVLEPALAASGPAAVQLD